MFQKKSENGQTVKVPVPEDLKNKQVLNEDEIAQLVELGKRIQEHYQFPQDTEWAIENGKIFMLQSRPVTTLDMGTASGEALHEGDRTVITKGLGASPGMAAGSVKIIKTTDELDKVQEGDILVTVMTTPDMVPAMKRANGIITDEGGVTCHAAIVSRELGIPCVVGTGDATSILPENSKVTLDGNKGIVWEGLLVETAKKRRNNHCTTQCGITGTINSY
nr:PEP-utilizing enzyme [Methanobacterium formicicum]